MVISQEFKDVQEKLFNDEKEKAIAINVDPEDKKVK